MEKDLFQEAETLKEAITKDPRLIRLNEIEKKMNEDEEVMALAYKKDMAAVKYSDVLNHYSEDSEEAKLAMHELYEAKLILDNHSLVREYLAAYKEVRELYDEINEILFSDLEPNLCPKVK